MDRPGRRGKKDWKRDELTTPSLKPTFLLSVLQRVISINLVSFYHIEAQEAQQSPSITCSKKEISEPFISIDLSSRLISQVRYARPQSLPLLANPALSLENWTATMNVSTTAAAIVLRTSQSLVSLTTQPLVLDSGRYRHLLALQSLQIAVAAKVGG